MLSRRTIIAYRTLTSNSIRRIGFIDMNEGPRKLKHLEQKKYDARKIPSLFTELDPAGLSDQFDSDGNQLSPIEAALRELHASIA